MFGSPERGGILVTGGNGFLGRHVVAELGRNQFGPILAPRRDECDLLDSLSVERYLMRTRPEAIVHLAARVGGIEANRRAPGGFMYANLAMGLHVIEAARRFGVAKFVNVGTICAYPKFTPVPFREADLWNGFPEETNAPYGVAKKTLMLLVDSYRREYGFPGVNLLPVNLYGPGDNFDLESSHVIPAMIRKFAEARERGDAVTDLWGTGTPTREFLYVADAARAIRLALEAPVFEQPINIGSGNEVSIRDLASLIADKIGYRGAIRFDASRPDGQPRRCLDVSLARQVLGFEARVDLSAGLDETIDWYLQEHRQVRRIAA